VREARRIGAHRVGSGREAAQGVSALFVRRGRLLRAVRALRRDGRADDRAAELVLDLTAQRPRALRKGRADGQRHDEREARAALQQIKK
jgi:hypothetical protein